jgi:hypothetical protein
MNDSDSTGVGEKQEHCENEEVGDGKDHHGNGGEVCMRADSTVQRPMKDDAC